jgi:hypothetical protein
MGRLLSVIAGVVARWLIWLAVAPVNDITLRQWYRRIMRGREDVGKPGISMARLRAVFVYTVALLLAKGSIASAMRESPEAASRGSRFAIPMACLRHGEGCAGQS